MCCLLHWCQWWCHEDIFQITGPFVRGINWSMVGCLYNAPVIQSLAIFFAIAWKKAFQQLATGDLKFHDTHVMWNIAKCSPTPSLQPSHKMWTMFCLALYCFHYNKGENTVDPVEYVHILHCALYWYGWVSQQHLPVSNGFLVCFMKDVI